MQMASTTHLNLCTFDSFISPAWDGGLCPFSSLQVHLSAWQMDAASAKGSLPFVMISA